jgi:hypothetical protein
VGPPPPGRPVEGYSAATTAPIGGRDQARTVRRLVDGARNELRLGAAAFGTRSAALDTWERRTGATVHATIRTLLSDAQISLREAVSQIVIKPEFQ